MRILIVNTSERTGGAAVAARRLMEALNGSGIKARMLVRDKLSDDMTVAAVTPAWRMRWYFLWERLCVWMNLRLRRDHLFDMDIANVGADITKHPWFREADVVHLHWVNQGMLSLKGIRRIIDSGKPVVWTMHDIWPATAICHLTMGCRQFERSCCHCRLLPGGGSEHDLAARVWRRKQQLLDGRRVTFVTCSRWLAAEAGKSALLQGQTVVSIPNAISNHYRPGDRTAARLALGLPTDRKLILFVSQRVTNPYKGMDYLAEACRMIAAERGGELPQVGVIMLGGQAEEMVSRLPLPAWPLGYVSDPQRIACVYQAADVFVLPSLSENLPNTIMESMACGVPCVAFRVGGIPEMIDHRSNGYVADYRDAADLARGLRYVLDEADGDALRQACLRKVARCYSPQSVARSYMEIYEEAMHNA